MNKTNLVMLILIGIVVVIGMGALINKFIQEASKPATPPPSASPDLVFDSPSASSEPDQKKLYSQFPGILPSEQLQNKKAILQTGKGTIEFEIFPDSPKAASNFIFLTRNGFYNNLTFHRVEDWVIQGGDPTGTGRGSPGYLFEDEPVTHKYEAGIVAMANAGPNTNGSQFFILKKDIPLEPKYTIFGKIISGMEVVRNIQFGDTMKQVTINNL